MEALSPRQYCLFLPKRYLFEYNWPYVCLHGWPHKKGIIADTTNDLLKSALLLRSNQEINNSAPDPPSWSERPPMIPYTYIDDSNGSERLNTNCAVKSISSNTQQNLIHAKCSEVFFKTVEERSSAIGFPIPRDAVTNGKRGHNDCFKMH